MEYEEEIGLIDHYRTCPVCREELEIQYIILRGLKQLEEEEDTFSYEFQNELTKELDNRYAHALHAMKSQKLSGFFFVFGCIFLIIFFILERIVF